MESKPDLKREVGVLGLSANLANIMIGAGIFALPAVVAASLGSASIFAYLFCGLLITLVMLCFAEIGSKVTKSGGVYAFIETAFGPYFGLLTVVLFCVSAVASDAAVANAIVDIMGTASPVFQTHGFRAAFFVFVFGLLGYINVRGVREGIGLVKMLILAKLAPLILLVLLSLGDVSMSNLAIGEIPTIGEIGKVSLLLFFAFQGAESGLSISGEVKNSKRTVPRAILISIAGALVLYILIQTVSQGVLGSELPSFTENPLAAVADKVFGTIGFTLITIGAAVSMFGALSSEVLSIPRVIFQAADDEVIPFAPLAKVHKKYRTPYVAVISYAALACLLALIGGFQQLAIISSAAILLVYLGVVLSVIQLRRLKEMSSIDGFQIPGGNIIPILAVLIILLMLSNLSLNEVLIMVALITILTLAYFVKSRL